MMRTRVFSFNEFNRRTVSALRCCAVAAVAVGMTVTGAGVGLAVAAPTVPVLWTAGGVDAGTTGAGQAARMTADSLGNVAVVSGPAGRNLAVTSYTSDGTFRWRRTVSPSSGTFVGDWIVAAPDDDLIAVGHSVSSNGTLIAITLVRYAADGTFQWRVDSTGTVLSMGRLVVDAGGNAYLGFNSILHKYSPSGVLLWATPTSVRDAGVALSPDNADVVLTGAVGGKWTTAAFDAATGTRRWLVTAAEGNAAMDVAVDSERVYVTGQGVTGAGTPSIAYFLTVIAYDRASGARLWRTDRKPVGAGSAAGLRMALAPDGSLVVTGQASRGFLDWYTVAFEATGAVRWEAVRDGGLNTDEIPRAVFALADGTTVVTGPGGPSLPGGYIQGVTAGYDPSGTLLWEAFSAQATAWAAALPNGGDVCATGGYDALVTCWRVAALASPPAAPSGLTVRLSGAILLSWQDNATDETAFSVERSEFTGTAWTEFLVLTTLPANSTSYSDSSFVAGREFSYRVRASNAGGFSAYSNAANITILSANDPPTAVMSTTPSSGTAPLLITFDGSLSTDTFGFVTAWSVGVRRWRGWCGRHHDARLLDTGHVHRDVDRHRQWRSLELDHRVHRRECAGAPERAGWTDGDGAVEEFDPSGMDEPHDDSDRYPHRALPGIGLHEFRAGGDGGGARHDVH